MTKLRSQTILTYIMIQNFREVTLIKLYPVTIAAWRRENAIYKCGKELYAEKKRYTNVEKNFVQFRFSRSCKHVIVKLWYTQLPHWGEEPCNPERHKSPDQCPILCIFLQIRKRKFSQNYKHKLKDHMIFTLRSHLYTLPALKSMIKHLDIINGYVYLIQ